MKLLRLLGAWVVVGTVGYGIGFYVAGHQDIVALSGPIFKTGAGVLAAASAMLAMVFRQLDTAPPKEFDDGREDRWKKLFGGRWEALWIRWGVLIVATLAAAAASGLLDLKPTWLNARHSFALGFSSLLSGLMILAITVVEVFHIRNVINKTNAVLRERARTQELLDRLQMPEPEKSSGHDMRVKA